MRSPVHTRLDDTAGEHVDVAIIGAGPAGLAAAARLDGEQLTSVIIDAGKPVAARDRDDVADMTQGHGGAGLFSDGKFSFFPSATALWSLPRYADLRSAYDWVCAVLSDAGLDTPPFPEDPAAYGVGIGEWVLKAYPSDYLSLPARLALTQRLVDGIRSTIRTETAVGAVAYLADEDLFELSVTPAGGAPEVIRAHRIIVATGRFGPLELGALSPRRTWKRLEVGFRIEQPAAESFFAGMSQLDPKLQLRSDDGLVEWRTFCACRSGEAVRTLTNGLWTVSGRADCPPTGVSNIGFNTRILDEELAVGVTPGIVAALRRPESAFRVSLDDVLAGHPPATNPLDAAYGAQVRELMQEGLARLCGTFGSLRGGDARLIGPTLEGVGWYPAVDGDLRMHDAPAFVAGDACGLFRGIVAAMISGRYAASALVQQRTVAQERVGA